MELFCSVIPSESGGTTRNLDTMIEVLYVSISLVASAGSLGMTKKAPTPEALFIHRFCHPECNEGSFVGQIPLEYHVYFSSKNISLERSFLVSFRTPQDDSLRCHLQQLPPFLQPHKIFIR